ncbi:hypothetical protein L1987_76002 [Smallanthus sonchifolius]|uniref:Uncharacterized protein n=1 Tax=Smallanthus sonchifolius TaxID=185202 RepID=A0ACB9A8A6_9ASTR|nr:hypothetical protein L1987_76002 [Smallanthus sonchifolius]
MAKDDVASGGQLVDVNCCSSDETVPKTRPTVEIHEKRIHGLPSRVLPDFAQVYGFNGSVFDSNTIGHLQRLKKIDPIDVETDHRKLLSTYEVDLEKENSDDAGTPFSTVNLNKLVISGLE